MSHYYLCTHSKPVLPLDDALESFEPEVIPSIPPVPELTTMCVTEVDNHHSRSSSTDLLDAFEFFTPTNDDPDGQPVSASPKVGQKLASPQINIIAASTENLATEDDMSYLDSLASSIEPAATRSASNAFDLVDDLDPLAQSAADNELHIATSSESESESEGKLVREDTMDFDEIMSRPVAKSNPNVGLSSSGVWGGTDDSGIGVEFKATFSVSCYG